LAALGGEDGNDFIWHFHAFLAEAAWELVGLELLQDFLKG
jgi:hypothetical protein